MAAAQLQPAGNPRHAAVLALTCVHLCAPIRAWHTRARASVPLFRGLGGSGSGKPPEIGVRACARARLSAMTTLMQQAALGRARGRGPGRGL